MITGVTAPEQQQPVAAYPFNMIPSAFPVGPLWGRQPSPAFWAALLAAQQAAEVIVKEEQVDGQRQKWKFSKAEDWIRICREWLLPNGLVVTATQGEIVPVVPDNPTFMKYTTSFPVVLAADGTGMLYRFDWPLWGGGASANFTTGGAMTYTVKYFLRGLLLVPQADEDVKAEKRDAERQQAQRFHGAAPAAAPAPVPVNYHARPAVVTPATHPHLVGNEPIGNEPIVHAAAAILDASPAALVTAYPERTPVHMPPPAPMPPVAVAAHGHYTPPAPAPVAAPAPQPVNGARVVEPGPQPEYFAPATPEDGGHDPSLEELKATGLEENLAVDIASLPPNQQMPGDAEDPDFKARILNAIRDYYGTKQDVAAAAWEGIGYVPAGRAGPRPSGAQLRRYFLKMNWTRR